MPGAFRFRHALNDAAVLQHHIMRGDVGAGGAKPRQRTLDVGHAGIVQQDHVRLSTVDPFAEIHGWNRVGNNRRIRNKSLHAKKRLGNWERAPTLRKTFSRGGRIWGHATAQNRRRGGERFEGESSASLANGLLSITIRSRGARCNRFGCHHLAFFHGRGAQSIVTVACGAQTGRLDSNPGETINPFLTLNAVTK